MSSPLDLLRKLQSFARQTQTCETVLFVSSNANTIKTKCCVFVWFFFRNFVVTIFSHTSANTGFEVLPINGGCLIWVSFCFLLAGRLIFLFVSGHFPKAPLVLHRWGKFWEVLILAI